MTEQTDTEIRASDAAPGDVLLQLSYPQSSDGQRARLTITDQMSDVVLASVNLTAEQLMSFMSTTATRVGGAHLPRRPELIGRRQETTKTNVDRNSDRTAEQVRDEYIAAGWESVQIQSTNFGCRVVARRWVADDDMANARRVAEGK
ncbi:hypothetical protein [Plantactinospora sp. WMMB782]|uniref:hypothetical protein n=1 Tax=Plantactinospora sp. WMMB782 TaxID=3404121 RepID=UPI003B93DE28